MNMTILQATPAGAGWTQWIFIVAIIVIFYFFMIRPQQQQQKKLKEQRNQMKVGDIVITNSGIMGRIDGIVKKTNSKGVEEVDSFIIKCKPDYSTRIQVSKDCVFFDIADTQSR